MLVDSKWLSHLLKLTIQKTGFFGIVILFMDMKSHIHTRQNFLGCNILHLKYCGNEENRVAYKW